MIVNACGVFYNLLRFIAHSLRMFSVLDNWSEIRRPKAIAPATRMARINVFVASVNCKVTSCCVALNAILPGTRE